MTPEQFAREKHAGQVYDGHGDYVDTHLAGVVAVLRDAGFTHPIYEASAWLHDVLEDTDATKEQIERAYTAQRIANTMFEAQEALSSLTRKLDQATRIGVDVALLSEARSSALLIAAQRLEVAASRCERADTEFGFRQWAEEARLAAMSPRRDGPVLSSAQAPESSDG